jgi:CheY-like chemotaxis protein
MLPEILCTGFAATPEILTGLRQEFYRINQMSPDDSYTLVYIERRSDLYEMSISIHHGGGEILVSAKGNTYESTHKKALVKTWQEIRRWRTNRFDEQELPFSQKKTLRLKRESLIQHLKQSSQSNILIVDDDPFSTKLVESCFQKLGCSTNLVTTGFEAVDQMTSKSYDLVVLDWNMPDINGSETIKSAQNLIAHDLKLNRLWGARKLPVVVFSGQSQKAISFPKCNHFQNLGFWSKAMPASDLSSQVSSELNRLSLTRG